jgi:hypothetical protein
MQDTIWRNAFHLHIMVFSWLVIPAHSFCKTSFTAATAPFAVVAALTEGVPAAAIPASATLDSTPQPSSVALAASRQALSDSEYVLKHSFTHAVGGPSLHLCAWELCNTRAESAMSHPNTGVTLLRFSIIGVRVVLGARTRLGGSLLTLWGSKETGTKLTSVFPSWKRGQVSFIANHCRHAHSRFLDHCCPACYTASQLLDIVAAMGATSSESTSTCSHSQEF